MIRKKFPHYKQPNKVDCAPTCIKILLEYFRLKHNYSFEDLRELCNLGAEGATIGDLSNGLEKSGFT